MIIKHLDEITREIPKMEGIMEVTLQWLFNRRDGTRNFAMRVFELKPGGVIPVHEHKDMEHEMFILDGEATATISTEGVRVRKGDALFVLPGERHGYINDSDKIFRFLCVIPVQKE